MGNDLIRCLPALHALSGCDTTSKIETKLAALNAVRKPGNYFPVSNQVARIQIWYTKKVSKGYTS